MTPTFRPETLAALHAVRRASRICARVQAALVQADHIAKSDASPVSIADFAAQAIIIHELQQAFPSIPVCGEEDSDLLRSAEETDLRERVLESLWSEAPEITADAALDAIDLGNYPGGASGAFWTVDPIDGTKGFIGGRQYAVALALIEGGIVTAGVLGCPNLDFADNKGALFVSEKGQGAWQLGQESDLADMIPAKVTPVDDLAQARLCESFEGMHSSHSQSSQIAANLGITAEPYRIDSQAKYAAVARGDADIYLRLPKDQTYREKIWDHAAGVLAVEEAGGIITDIHGAPLDFAQGSTLANNQGVVVAPVNHHAEILAATRDIVLG